MFANNLTIVMKPTLFQVNIEVSDTRLFEYVFYTVDAHRDL